MSGPRLRGRKRGWDDFCGHRAADADSSQQTQGGRGIAMSIPLANQRGPSDADNARKGFGLPSDALVARKLLGIANSGGAQTL